MFRKPATAGELSLLEAVISVDAPDADTPTVMSVKSARGALWSALENGQFRATAIDPKGNIVEIAPSQWAYLEINHKQDLSDYLINGRQPLDPAYSDLKFRASDII